MLHADVGLSRREMLCRSGLGLGGLALGQLLAGAPALAAGAEHLAACSAVAPFSGQGQARHSPVHERRAVASRHVRPQAGPGEVCRSESADYAEDRTPHRRGSAVAVQIHQVWPVGHRSQRAVSQRGTHDRRRGRHPFDARRRAEPRAVAAVDELRRSPAGPAEFGFVADLRSGNRQSKPARLHCHVPRRLSDPGIAELASRISAGRVSGQLHQHGAHADRSADRARHEQIHDRGRSAARSRSAGAAQRPAPGPARWRSAIGSTDSIVRVGLPHADGGGRRLRREPRAAARSRHVWPRARRRGRS